MKKIYLYAAALSAMVTLGGCRDLLNQSPDRILTQDQTYGDEALMKSAIAQFYGRVMWGQKIEDWDAWTRIDEAVHYDTNSDSQFDRNTWREYPYDLIRELNVFMDGVKNTPQISDESKKAYIAEARYIRAWVYFCMVRSLGGVPIVGDKIFDYTPGMDITELQIPRSTEAETYDYVISECGLAAADLTKATNKNNARANYWVAKMLQARAAIYAASLATYNTPQAHPQLRTANGEVGIPANKAKGYYETALAAAKEVINDGPYKLMESSDRTQSVLADNFYKAVCQKDGNTEVIWTFDFIAPGKTHQFTKENLPKSIAQDLGGSRLSILLNLVEEFELLNTPVAERGQAKQFNIGTLDNPVFYNDPLDLFVERDPRLMATVLVPGSKFGGQTVEFQAGQLIKESGKWAEKVDARNSYDDQKRLITHNNGPLGTNDREINRTGFAPHKYLDTAPGAGTIGRGSDMWNVHFRISEAYLIAAEAQWMLSGQDADATALGYINKVRNRAGVQPLASLSRDKMIHEYRVEFAFEGHRWWTLKRFMKANELWTGDQNKRSSQRLGLWPFKVVAPGDPNDGKWVFIEKDMQKLDLWRNPYKCTDAQYYAEIDNGWINNNPKLVKNPYQ